MTRLLVSGVINNHAGTDWADMGQLIQLSSWITFDLPPSLTLENQDREDTAVEDVDSAHHSSSSQAAGEGGCFPSGHTAEAAFKLEIQLPPAWLSHQDHQLKEHLSLLNGQPGTLSDFMIFYLFASQKDGVPG